MKPFTKNENIVVVTTKRGKTTKREAVVLKINKDDTLNVKFEDGTKATVDASNCQHKRGRKANATATSAAKKTEKPVKVSKSEKSDKKQTAKSDANPKFKHTLVMAAMGKGSAEGRLMDFVRNPNGDTRDAILNAAKIGLDALIKKYGGKSAKSEKSDKNDNSKKEGKKTSKKSASSKSEKPKLRVKAGRRPMEMNAAA